VIFAAGLIVLVALVVFAVIKDRAAAAAGPSEAQARQLIAELWHTSIFEQWLDKLGLKKARQRRHPDKVIDDLAALGTPAIRPLIQALQETPESHVGQYCAEALAGIGPPAVPALMKTLDYRNPNAGRRAAVALGNIGPDAKQAVPKLLEALKNVHMCDRAAEALGRIGPAAAPAVPALIDALKDGHRRLHRSAAWALGEIGPAAKDAIPALTKALKDKNPDVRSAAGASLAKLGLPDKGLPVLIAVLEGPEWYYRKRVAIMLGEVGPPAKAAIPALKQALKDRHREVGWAAAEALKKIQAAPAPATKPLATP
jgi:HEAT repeat protein